MEELAPLLTLATAGLAATGMTAVAALRGWQDWLDVRRAAVDATTGRRRRAGRSPTCSARVRRLEAIANGSE